MKTTEFTDKFNRGVADLKRVSLTPDEKGKMFGRLLRYTEANQPVAKKETFFAPIWNAVLGFLRT